MKKVLSAFMTVVMMLSVLLPINVVAATWDNSEIISNEIYKITAKHSGKALDVVGGYTNDGANVQQWTDNGNAQQQWKVIDVGGGYYKLISVNSGKALDVEGGYTHDGANVQQWADNSSSHQRWKILSTGDGYYKLIAECSQKALDVVGGYTNDGANVQQWTDNGNDQQKWKFTRVSNTDTQAPTKPTGLNNASQTKNSVTISWNASTDNIGVAGYDIYVDNLSNLVGSTAATNYTVTSLEANKTYTIYVQAKDAAGNKSETSNISAKTLRDDTDTQAPTAPTNISEVNKTSSTITLSWAASNDNAGVVGYDIYVNNSTSIVGTTSNTSYTLTGLSPDTYYTIYIQAKDAAGNKSDKSSIQLKTEPVKVTGGFYIKGTTLYDANGNPFVMRGINHAYTWYQGEENKAIPAIAKTDANCVRIVLSDGQQYSKTSLSELQKLIKLCEDNKLIAIVEVHDVTGSDDIQALEKVAQYWIEMKSALIGKESTVILNIANEWAGKWDTNNWRNGYTSVIPKLRDAGIKNTIMVDCAGWGQYPDSIFEAGKAVAQSDKLQNTMFSIHMYEYAGAYGKVQSNIDAALNIGYPLCIGEFGIKHTDGPVDYKTIMSYCEQKGAGYIGWSWKGNGDKWSYLDMVQDWEGTMLTEQGRAIIHDQYGIKNTSKICSVFNNSPLDKEPPTVPTNLNGTATSYNSITLNWSASSDNIGVTGYNIYQDGKLISISQVTNYTVKGLKANTSYDFSVSAIDMAGNESAKSGLISVKTLDSNDKEAPAVPANLKGTVSITTASLSWTASIDNIGVAGYRIYQDGIKIGTSTKTSYGVSGLAENTLYTFIVTAFDDAGNESLPSTKLTLETGSKGTVPTINPGIIADYDDWYVGINGKDKSAIATVAKITKLETGGLEMTFNLTTENYPCFQVDPATTLDWSSCKNMNIVVTNPNDKEIQLQTIVKDKDWEWVEPGQYAKIPAKTTVMLTIPLEKAKTANRIIFRVQSGSGGYAGSIQIHAVDFDLTDGVYATTIAEMNRPKSASYYTWNHKESSFGKTVESGLKEETIYAKFTNVTAKDVAGVSTETQPGLGTGQDWSQYANISCTLTNKGTTPIHVSLVLRTGGGWTWQETGGTIATDNAVERIIEPGESVDVVYDFNAPIWKSAVTKWINSAVLDTPTDVKGIQFKIYAGEGEVPVSGTLEITSFSLNF